MSASGLDDKEWQISKIFIQNSIQTYVQVSKKSYFDIWHFSKSYSWLRLIWGLDHRSRSRSRRSRYILPGAGAGAGADEQFYSEPEPEPEPECFPGAGAGAGADQKCHGSASLLGTIKILLDTDFTSDLAHFLHNIVGAQLNIGGCSGTPKEIWSYTYVSDCLYPIAHPVIQCPGKSGHRGGSCHFTFAKLNISPEALHGKKLDENVLLICKSLRAPCTLHLQSSLYVCLSSWPDSQPSDQVILRLISACLAPASLTHAWPLDHCQSIHTDTPTSARKNANEAFPRVFFDNISIVNSLLTNT